MEENNKNSFVGTILFIVVVGFAYKLGAKKGYKDGASDILMAYSLGQNSQK